MRKVLGWLGGWGRECLPFDEREKLHDDWIWPFSLIPRWFNAFCGVGPSWLSEHEQPVPLPGRVSYHMRDESGSWRPYFAITFDWWVLYGFHVRTLFRWTVVTHDPNLEGYYNLLPISFGFEYDSDGNPI